MAISNIGNRGSWYDIYNELGKKTKSLSINIGKIEGFCSVFLLQEEALGMTYTTTMEKNTNHYHQILVILFQYQETHS